MPLLTFLLRLWQEKLVHVVDILLVAFIIYHVLLLMQGTRAVQEKGLVSMEGKDSLMKEGDIVYFRFNV